MQPRTSPSKFGGKFNLLFIRLLDLDADQTVAGNVFFPDNPGADHKSDKRAIGPTHCLLQITARTNLINSQNIPKNANGRRRGVRYSTR